MRPQRFPSMASIMYLNESDRIVCTKCNVLVIDQREKKYIYEKAALRISNKIFNKIGLTLANMFVFVF